MKNPLNKRRDALLPPDVEQMLRASASWEPDALPNDFAAFTRQALEKRERKAWALRKMQPVRWTNALRSPLTVGLASACVLWAGAKVNAPDEAVLNPAPFYAAASPLVSSTAPPQELTVPSLSSPRLVLAATNDASDAAAPVATPPQAVRFRSSYRAPASHSAGHRSCYTKHNAPHRLWGAETVAVNKPGAGKATCAASLWETETVLRPAWGALVPVPTAAQCAACDTADATNAAEGVETSEPRENEATSALLPVLDVALPDVETPMPTSSPAPAPSFAK